MIQRAGADICFSESILSLTPGSSHFVAITPLTTCLNALGSHRLISPVTIALTRLAKPCALSGQVPETETLSAYLIDLRRSSTH